MTRRFASLACALVLCLPAFADDASPVTATGAAPGARASNGSSRRVRVKLRTGRSIDGVVLAAGTWERHDGAKGWVAAQREEKGAGIRLWWVHDLDGFQFVSVRDLTDVRDVGTVSADESRDAEKRRRDASERTETERRRADAERAATAAAVEKAKSLIDAVAAAKAEAAAADAAPAAGTAAAETKRFAELLGRFPPEEWTPSSPAAIERRRIVMGINPTDRETAFLAVFDEWKKAWEAWSAAQVAVKPASASTTPVAPAAPVAPPAPATPPAAPKRDAGNAPAPQPGAKK